MKIGLHLADYNFPGGSTELATNLAAIAQHAERAGFSALSVTDHLWQTSTYGEETDPMLDAYSALGYLVAHTDSLELMTLVTAATYRPPELLAAMVSSLDSLSGGRAWLGLGAGWNEQEAVGLGLELGSVAQRFEAVENCLAVCLKAWDENSPGLRQRPRILIGGAGERRTLRLVAKYADACNVYGGPEAGRKLAVLRSHCRSLGRDYDSIEKTALVRIGAMSASGLPALTDQLRSLSDVGFSTVFIVPAAGALLDLVDAVGKELVPQAATWPPV